MRDQKSKSARRRQRRLVLILGDQLSPEIAALQSADRRHDIVLMAEVAKEATYVRHHKKKLAFSFSAMRHFSAELSADGWTVDYITLDDEENSGSIAGEIRRAVARYDFTAVIVTEPGEWRLLNEFQSLRKDMAIPVDILADHRFICSKSEFAEWSAGRRQMRMEDFYRYMRRKTKLLMDGDSPEGGRWNYDKENRKPPKKGLTFHGPHRFPTSTVTQEVLELVGRHFANHFGTLEPFWFGVTRGQAESALEHFIDKSLGTFGDYQDAMLTGEHFLYHAVISIYLNAGLLDPLATCQRVEAAYRAGQAPLNAAEGFIRQIIGWREYVRGVYWLHMPDYVDSNFLEHKRPLPDFYWTGETDMACLRACIEQTRDEAYAHHIQRLMVTGNFAMLAGIDPKAVHEWYLTVYADAYEWVELPNTIGMSQFADGGLLASKPYAASANYIRRMSDYCASCRYKAGRKTGPEACPFNYLYWDFLRRNRGRLGGNPRLAQIYRTWDRIDPDRKTEISRDATRFLKSMTQAVNS